MNKENKSLTCSEMIQIINEKLDKILEEVEQKEKISVQKSSTL